jgi:hypothetical protein
MPSRGASRRKQRLNSDPWRKMLFVWSCLIVWESQTRLRSRQSYSPLDSDMEKVDFANGHRNSRATS